MTWSEPGWPRDGMISRASSRKRRFMRLRTTAPPTFLLTVKPTRFERIAVLAIADEKDEARRRRAPTGVRSEEVRAFPEDG